MSLPSPGLDEHNSAVAPGSEPAPLYSSLPRSWLVLWVLMMVVTGTYLRTRQQVESSMDWLVVVRLLIFGMVGVIGLSAFRQQGPLGKSAMALLVYLLGLWASLPLSPSKRLVAGYLILVSGAILFLIRIGKSLRSVEQVERFEIWWAVIMFLIAVKDSLRSLLAGAIEFGTETARLGLEGNSPAMLGLYAVLAFVLIQNSRFVRNGLLRSVLLVVLLFVILGCRTRIIFIALAASQIFLFLSKQPRSRHRLGLVGGMVVFSLFLLDHLAGGPISTMSANWLNRGQEIENLSSMSGRDQIWRSAISIASESPKTILLGFGYGATRFHLNWRDNSPEFMASHCHDAFLEHYFATGLLGLSCFLLLLKRAVAWRQALASAHEERLRALAVRAMAVLVVLLVTMITEVPVGVGKVNPAALLLFFYVIVLDWMLPYLEGLGSDGLPPGSGNANDGTT